MFWRRNRSSALPPGNICSRSYSAFLYGPPGEVPFMRQRTRSKAHTATGFAAFVTVSTLPIGQKATARPHMEETQPSQEIGSHPHPPHPRGPNQAFLPTRGEVRMYQ